MSPNNLDKSFTLVIPTYNRPADLARLLGLLARHQVTFPIVVLDSSSPDVRVQNDETVAKLGLSVKIISFESTIAPFDKFAAGAELVETRFAALCADDDLVVPGSLDPIVRFLSERPDYSAAHGWYFAFKLGRDVELPSIVYRGASLDDPAPLRRLHACFGRYEALTYAVYRSDVLKRALAQTRRVDSIMEKELVGAAIAAIYGKVARLPLFYYGRSLAPSETYANWLPVNFLAASPARLFASYPAYRSVLIEALSANGCEGASSPDVTAIVDLIHLRYLADYAKPALLDDLIKGKIAGEPADQIARNALPLLVEARSSIEHLARHSRWLRRLRNRFVPGLRLFHLKKLLPQTVIQSTTAGGQPRRYCFHRGLVAALEDEVQLRSGLQDLVHVLDRYEQIS